LIAGFPLKGPLPARSGYQDIEQLVGQTEALRFAPRTERFVLPEGTMEISALVKSAHPHHEVTIRTGAMDQTLAIPSKSTGRGSAVNGGEFLMLALATCYCNDLYREAERLQLSLESVEVEASAEFPGVGLAATNIRCRAKVSSSASLAAIAELMRLTDVVAEVHNTIRTGMPVSLIN
jgi:organic hydroperoxide reductase OsmC/OhrA